MLIKIGDLNRNLFPSPIYPVESGAKIYTRHNLLIVGLKDRRREISRNVYVTNAFNPRRVVYVYYSREGTEFLSFAEVRVLLYSPTTFCAPVLVCLSLLVYICST